jgi:chitodextrinase
MFSRTVIKSRQLVRLLAMLMASLVLSGCGAGSADAPSGTTGEPNAATAFAVTETLPSNGSTGVSLNSPIAANFLRAVTNATLNTLSFTVTPAAGGAPVPGSVVVSNNNVAFVPSGALAVETDYIATITGWANDGAVTAGAAYLYSFTWWFRTGSFLDTTPPTVSSASPANGATDVALNRSVSASFSEPMTNSTLTTATFTLRPTAGTATVTGTVNVSGSTATFTPTVALAGSTQYTATITTGARDAAGNALPADFSWSFTTAAAPDTTSPTVSSWSPAVLATGIALNTLVSVTFSEPMNNATLTTANFTLQPDAGGDRVIGTVNVSGNTATFMPVAGLAGSTRYRATISTAAKDAAGNSLPGNYSWVFTTVAAPDTTPPSVPAGLSGTAFSSTQINLSWGASTDNVGVTGYYVYLNDVALGTTTATSFQHTGLAAGTTYNYRVSGYDAVPNHSAWTATPVSVTTTANSPVADTTPPSVPAGLTATAVSSTQINLSWGASTDNVGVTGYYVYLNDVALGTTTATSFQHTGLAAGTTYNYRVSGYDAVPNHSAWTATPVSAKTPSTVSYLPVIPGAAGYGMHTRAGRGGTVYKVTNLNASGAGSLRACTDASGPRVCVFEVSGNIDLARGSINIYEPFLTIAGQTAPAPGISIINGNVGVMTHDVLIQHIRTRGGLAPERLTPIALYSYLGAAYNIVIDHVSTAWSTDDLVLTWYGAHDITWSHVLATGELFNPDVYFDATGKVMLTDSADYNILMVGSALVTGQQRMPLAQANPFVFVNNIVYNWGGAGTHFQRQPMVSPSGVTTVVSGGEFVMDNNHYVKGPLNSQAWSPKPILIDPSYWVPGVHIYLNGNYAPDWSINQQWDMVDNRTAAPRYSQADLQVFTPGAWPEGLVARSAANGGIFDWVLQGVGAFPLSRDSLDARLVNDVRNRTGGTINSTIFPTLARNQRTLTLPANPNSDDDGDGYTNLEEWLHCMAAQVEGRPCQ